MKEMIGELASLGKLLEVTALRHRVTAHNLANLNTPGYQKQEVRFEELLDRSLGEQAIVESAPQVIRAEGGARGDGNNVSIEEEINTLTSNSLAHQTYIKALSFQIKALQGAILGRF